MTLLSQVKGDIGEMINYTLSVFCVLNVLAFAHNLFYYRPLKAAAYANVWAAAITAAFIACMVIRAAINTLYR